MNLTAKMSKWEETTRSYMVHDDTCIKGFFGEYFFLSNFCQRDIPYSINKKKYIFGSSEALYQALKSKDPEVIKKFTEYSPKEAKVEGRKVQLRENWDRIKSHIMFNVLYLKFLYHKDIRKKLVETGYKYLEETNHWKDEYFGVDANSEKGLNILGQELMNVRVLFQMEVDSY